MFIAGLSLTKADLIISRSGSAPGSNTGGGYSWIHPRLMTHFLQWCCPEFAEEVLDVFQRYLSGDPELLSQSITIRAATLEKELQAAQDDIIHRDKLLSEREAELQQMESAIASAHKEVAAKADAAKAEIQRIRDESEEKYQELVAAHDAKVAEVKNALQELEQAADDQVEALEDIIARDPTRPCNIFKQMQKEDIPESNRHTEIKLWFPARHITIDACIFFANRNVRLLMGEVLRRGIGYHPFVKFEMDSMTKRLESKKRSHHIKVRREILKMLRSLSAAAKDAVLSVMYEAVVYQFQEVFCCTPSAVGFTIKTAINNVSLYALLCKCLKEAYQVDYSTEIETKYLAKMALNFNAFVQDDCAIPLGPDYDDVEVEDTKLIEYP